MCAAQDWTLRRPATCDEALGIGNRPYCPLLEAGAIVHGGYLLLCSPEG